MVSRGGYRSRRGIPALGFCEFVVNGKMPLPPKYPRELKTIGNHLLKRRYDLKMSQSQVAKIIGVTTDSITYWENGRSVPQIGYAGKIIKFLGYNPYHIDNKTFGDKLKNCRYLNGLTQKELAQILNIDPSTVGAWEKDTLKPKAKLLKKVTNRLNSLL